MCRAHREEDYPQILIPSFVCHVTRARTRTQELLFASRLQLGSLAAEGLKNFNVA